jgi:hypothetical protein
MKERRVVPAPILVERTPEHPNFAIGLMEAWDAMPRDRLPSEDKLSDKFWKKPRA